MYNINKNIDIINQEYDKNFSPEKYDYREEIKKINDILDKKADKNYLDIKYISKDEFRKDLENKINKTYLDDNYYNKFDIKDFLANKTSIEYLENNYYNKEILQDKLSEVTSYINEDIDNLNINLSKRISKLENSTPVDMNNYYTKSQVDNNIYDLEQDISKIDENLTSKIENIHQINDDLYDSVSKIYNKFDNYADKTLLNNYYNKQSIETIINDIEQKIPSDTVSKSYISDNFYNKRYINDRIKELDDSNYDIMDIISTKTDKSYLNENYYNKNYIENNFCNVDDTYKKNELYPKDLLYTKQDVDDIIKDDIPTGTIIMYVGSLYNSEFLLCDGREIVRSIYKKLFNIIGVSFGDGDGFKTFNLPKIEGQTISENTKINFYIKY